MKDIPITKRHPIGEWHGHYYELDGVVSFQECTKEEYEALALPGAGAPNVPGKWLVSKGGMVKFDTENGFLQEADYWEPEEGKVVINLDGVGCLASTADILDGKLKADTVLLRAEPLTLGEVEAHT